MRGCTFTNVLFMFVTDENEIREYVENFLKKNEEITSQTVL